MKGALEGVRILDLSRVAAGPYCTSLFGDMGAEVLKTEKRGKGDDFRPKRTTGSSFNIMFYNRNRNKYSLEIDFRSEKGRKLLQDIAAKSDLVVENYRAGTVRKMGLSDAEVEQINPGLVVVSISGFGQDGPLSHKTSYDPLAQMASGVTTMVGEAAGGPNLIGYIAGDMTAGLFGAIGGMAALICKERTGRGQRVDISMLDVMASILVSSGVVAEYTLNGVRPKGNGNRDRFVCPSNTFMASDRLLMIDCRTDEQFMALAETMGRKEWAVEQGFTTNAARLEQVEAVEGAVQEWTRGKTAEEVEQILAEADVPCAVVRGAIEASEMPVAKERELIRRMDFLDYPNAPITGVIGKLSKTTGGMFRRTPELGEHTDEVLKRVLGMSDEEIQTLHRENIV